LTEPESQVDLNEDGVFAKIVRGEIPCHKVYEDPHVLAFLDIGPLAYGHTLVIPKKAYRRLEEMDEQTAAAVGRVLPKIGRAVMKAAGASDYNVLQNNGASVGQAVEHVHFHLIPHDSQGRKLNFQWTPGELSDEDASRLKQSMGELLKVE